MTYEKYAVLQSSMRGLLENFQAEKEKESSVFYDPSNANMAESRYQFTRGKIVGILSCIIILKNELKRLGIIDNEDTKLVDEGQGVAAQSQ